MAADAPVIWDSILEKRKTLGIIPCAFTTLDWLRVESCFLFFPYDNSEKYLFADQPAGDTLWELGLDFTVSPTKGEFRGGTEHARLKDASASRFSACCSTAIRPPPKATACGRTASRSG